MCDEICRTCEQYDGSSCQSDELLGNYSGDFLPGTNYLFLVQDNDSNIYIYDTGVVSNTLVLNTTHNTNNPQTVKRLKFFYQSPGFGVINYRGQSIQILNVSSLSNIANISYYDSSG